MVAVFVVVVLLPCLGALFVAQVRENRHTRGTARAAQAEAERIVRRID